MKVEDEELAGRLSLLLDGFRASQCIHVAAALGLADAIGEDEERSTTSLAASLGLQADALRRLMRVLVSLGLFARTGTDGWTHSPGSRLLRSSHPAALGQRARTLGTLAWQSWGALEHSVRTGESAFDHVHGKPFFTFLEEHPELAIDFGSTMTSFTRATAGAVARAYDFSRHRSVVDVGGGHGVMLDVLLSSHPHLTGTLVDRPEVVEAGAPALGAAARQRCRFEALNFFEDPLPAADVHVLSWILHDWNDDDCIRLLSACRHAMSETGELLVVEMVVPEHDEASPAKMFDLEMMVQTGGRERTEAEYRTLLDAAGLRLEANHRTTGPHSVLVAKRASP